MCATSQVVLGGVTLDLDPTEYRPLDGVRRGTVFRLIDGTRIVQDRGFSLTGDGVVSLKGTLINLSTVQALLALFEAGGSMTLTDFKGNEFVVVFAPGRPFPVTPMTGSNRGWQYEIDLIITQVVKILGNTP